MADTVSRSVIEFTTAGTEKATGAFADVERKARDSQGSIGKLAGSVGNLTTAFKAFLGLEIVGRLVQGLAAITQAVDHFDTLAGRIGATVEDAQRLQSVATTFDTSLEAIVAGIQTMAERLGADKLDEPLQRLNIEVERFRGLNGHERYILVAEALGRLTDADERAALAKELLGAQAKALAATFREDVSSALDDVIVISNDTAEAIDLLASGWEKTTQSAVGFGAELLSLMTGMRQYVQLRDLFSAPVLPDVAPVRAHVEGIKDLTLGEKDLARVEKDLTQSAEERIKTTTRSIAATQDRQKTEREYYNWLGERQMQAASAEIVAIEQQERRWREYYNWLGERRMEDDTRRMQQPLPGTPLDPSTVLEPFKQPAVRDAVQQSMKPIFAELGRSLSTSILRAVQGGGSIPQAIGADLGGMLGQKVGDLAGAKIGGALGGALGMALGPLGSIGGALLGKGVGKLFDKVFKSEGKKVNDLRDQFTAAAGGIDTLARKADEAGLSLERFYRAKTIKEANAAIEELQSSIDRHAKKLELAKVAAEEFGIPYERMGQAFKQGENDLTAANLLEKINALIAAGTDLDTVIEFAGDDLGRFIHTAIEMGTTVPKELQGIVAKMIEQGKLIDKNGEAFTEMGQVPWAESTNEILSNLSDTIKELAAALKGLPSSVNIDVNANVPNSDDVTPQYDVGTVGRHGSFWRDFRRGTRAMLHGIEAVVTPRQAPAFAASVLGAMGMGGSGGSLTPLVITADGATLARVMVRHTGRVLGIQGVA